MEDGTSYRERLAGRNVWTEGVRSWLAAGAGGFAGAGSPVPRGVPQLPRPAIIRLSGATISVNVPDSELRARARPTS